LSLVGAVWAAGLGAGAGCSDDDPGSEACVAGSGPVAGEADTHCVADDGTEIAQEIGLCVTGADAEALGEEEEEEELTVRYGNEADDDDCKYRVRFTNTCVSLNQPVTFTLTLTRKADGDPGSGGTAASPEVYLADDPTHISPSNDITAPEGPPGTYRVGPIVFDRSGRWVVRFHYFETCSDIPEDAPHGHVAFYIDVP
jgi:hypothetical protein